MELLTGKAKEDFENYVKELKVAPYVSMLNEIPKTYLNALIIDWFDSVGLKIFIEPTTCIDVWHSDIYGWTECFSENLESRQEATTEAIKKACEIYNNKK